MNAACALVHRREVAFARKEGLMKKLYVVRGLPGSGKSALARTLAPIVIEPDMFRYDENMEYVFDSDENSDVIRKSNELEEYVMRHLKMRAVAMTATFTKIAHMEQAISTGKKNGYDVTVVECVGDYGNVHNVPKAVLDAMAERFEKFTERDAERLGVKFMRKEQE